MMEIYTSYFSNIKKLKSEGIVPIGIALWKPLDFKGATIPELFPDADMVLHKFSHEIYIEKYKQYLNNLNPDDRKYTT